MIKNVLAIKIYVFLIQVLSITKFCQAPNTNSSQTCADEICRKIYIEQCPINFYFLKIYKINYNSVRIDIKIIILFQNLILVLCYCF